MRSPTVTFVVWALCLSYVSEIGGAVLGGNGNGIRNSNGGYNVPQPNLPALYSAPKTRQEQAIEDFEQDPQPTSTDRDSTTTEIYFDNSRDENDDDDATSDDYQFASTGTTPSPQSDYPNSGYTTINPTEPIRQGGGGYAGYVNNQGKSSLDQNTARPLDQQQIENQLYPRQHQQQQISPEQRTANGRPEYGPPSPSPQQFPLQLPSFVNQDRGSSQYLPPASAGRVNNRPETYIVPQNAISLPDKGTFDEQTSQRSRIGGETTQQSNFPRDNNAAEQQQQQQQQPKNINYYNDGQRGIGGENRYLPPAEQLPREQSLPASASHGQQQHERRQDQQLLQGEDQIRSPQQYYGTVPAFQNFQTQRIAYERPQQQEQPQQVNQQPQLQYLEQPQREQYQPQEHHQPQIQSQQQQFPSPQYQQQPSPQYQQQQSGPEYQQPQQSGPQYQQPQLSGPQYQQPAPQYEQASPQQLGASYPQQQQQQPSPQYQQQTPSPQYQQQTPSPQYQQQTPSPQYQQQPQSTPSYQQPANQIQQQQQPGSQYQQQQQSAPGYQQQTPPNQLPQNQQYPTTTAHASKVNPPSSTPPSHGFEFDHDHFHENDNVVDAELLLRVQKIIEDHERQQTELREKSRRENEYFQDNSPLDNQLSYSSGNPSNQGYYNENPGSFPSNPQSQQPVHHQEYRQGDNRLETSPHSQSLYPAQQGANKYSFPSATTATTLQQQDSPAAAAPFNNPEINREQNNGDLGFQRPTQLGGQPSGYQISNAPITTATSTSPQSNSIEGGRGGREYSNEKSTPINSTPYIEYQKAILTDHFVETRPEFPSQRSQYLPPPPSPPQSQEKAEEDSVFISNPQIASFPSPLVSTNPGNHPSNEIVQAENQQQPLPQQQQQQPIAYNQNRVENIHFPSPNNGQQSPPPSQIYSGQEQLLTSQPEYHQYNSNNYQQQGGPSDQTSQQPPLLQPSNAYVPSFPPQQNPVLSFVQYGGNPSSGSNAIEISPNVHPGFVQSPFPQEQDQQQQQQQNYVPQQQQQEPLGNSYPQDATAAPVNQQENHRTINVHEVPYGTVQGVTNRAVISPNDFTFSRENKLNVDGNQNSFSPAAPASTSSNNDFSSANEDPSFAQDPYRSPLVSHSQPQQQQQQGREANPENSQFPNNQQANVNGQERDLQSSYLPQPETASQQVQTWPSVHSINNVAVDTPKPIYGIPLAPVVDPDSLNLSNNDPSLSVYSNVQQGSVQQTSNNNQFFPVQAYSQQQQQQQQPQEQIYLQSNKYFLPQQPVLFLQDGSNNNLDFNGQPSQQQQQQQQQQPQIVFSSVVDARDSNAWNPVRNSVVAYQSPANVQEVNSEVVNGGNFNNINEYGAPSVVRSQELAANQGYLYPRRYRSIKRIRRIRKPVTPSSVSSVIGGEDATKQ